MGRKGRARGRYDKAMSHGAAVGFAGANRGSTPRVQALGDAINAATGARRVIDDETLPLRMVDMMRDPRDDVAFGPSNPLAPASIDPSRRDTGRPEPRLTEYPVAWNLPGNADAPMPWATLRAAAANVDIMRRCISVRKEQLQGLDWSITLDDQVVQGMYAASDGSQGRADIESDLRRKLLPEIDRLTTFMRNPWAANGVSFEQWVNGIMEDHLVLDAVAVYPRVTYGGDVTAFELIDPTTIKLLIDYRGARPVAPYPAFQQVLYGFPRAEFSACASYEIGDDGKAVEIVEPGLTADQLWYFREEYRSFTPYGYSAVQQALISARLYLKRQGWMIAEYDDGSTPLTFLVPDGTDASLVEKLTPRTRRQWEDSINDELAGQTRARNRMKVLMPGMTPHQMAGVDERYKPDYDMHLIKMLAGHFGVTSSGLGFSESKGLGNSGLHEGQERVQDAATTAPDKRMIERIVNELMCTFLKAPNELKFKFTDVNAEDAAAEDAAANAQRARGTITLNDDRRRIGKSPYPFKEADMALVLVGNAWTPLDGMAAKLEEVHAAERDALTAQTEAAGAVEGEEVAEQDAAKSLELSAYRRWARRRGGDARRPFTCESLEPADFVKGVPLDVAFAEWEWVPDGLADDVEVGDIAKAFGGNDNWRSLARDSKGRWVKRGSMRVNALGPVGPDKPVLAGLRADAERRRAASSSQLRASDSSTTIGGMTTPRKTPPPVPSREERAAALREGAASMLSGRAAPTSMGERIRARQESDVRDVVNELADAPGGWVAMADVRRKLAERGLDRGQQDAVLRRMATEGDRSLNMAPEDNQKTLTDADHAAAIDLGAGPQHVISIDPPRKSVLDTVRESSEQAARASAVIDSVPGLREGMARQQGVKPVKLSSAQHEALRSGKTSSEGYLIADRRVMPALERAGLAEQVKTERYGTMWRATPAGAEALARADADLRAELDAKYAPDHLREAGPRDPGSSADPELVTVRPEGRQNNVGHALPSTPPAAVKSDADLVADIQARGAAVAGGYVSLAMLRPAMGGTRAEQDAALKRLDRARVIILDPDPNRKAIPQEGHDAAIEIGGEPKHLVSVLDGLPSSTPPAARAEAVAASTPDAPSADTAPITASMSGTERFSGPRGRTEMKARLRELSNVTRAQYDALPDDVKARITADLAHIGAQEDWTEGQRSARFSGSRGLSGVPMEARGMTQRLITPLAPAEDNSPSARVAKVRAAANASQARNATHGASKAELIEVSRELGIQWSNGWKVDKFRDEIAKKAGTPKPAAPVAAPSVGDMMAANMAASVANPSEFGAAHGKVTNDQIGPGTRLQHNGTAWEVLEKPRKARADAKGREGKVFRARREDQGIESTMRLNDGATAALAAPKGGATKHRGGTITPVAASYEHPEGHVRVVAADGTDLGGRADVATAKRALDAHARGTTQPGASPARQTMTARMSAPLTGAAALAAAPKDVEAVIGARGVDRAGRVTIERYRGKAFTEINRELRSGAPSAETLRTAEQIDRVMNESKLTAPIVTHRAIGDVDAVFGAAAGRKLTGHEWTDAAPQSTSTDQDKADTFLAAGGNRRAAARITMRVPAGVGAIQLSGERYEAELLLQRGLRMRVISDTGPWRRGQKNPRTIEVEVIPA